jgi:hypothetical protein
MKITQYLLVFVIIVTNLFILNVSALPATFDREMVLTDQDLYSLPLSFSSADKIQSYLQYQNSVLALITVPIGFIDYGENDVVNTDDLILKTSNTQIPEKYSPRVQVQNQSKINNTQVQLRPADIIWKIAQENFGNSCRLDYSSGVVKADTSICIDNEYRPINPAFILAMIQKESSLIYGSCAKPDADYNSNCSYSNPNSINKIAFRMDRAMGYWCFEGSKSTSCYDENPVWKYQKGFFQQVYKGIRLLRLRSETCNLGGYNGYKTNTTVNIDGVGIYLKNGITCALYIYTPHISNDKINIYNNLKYFGADYNLVQNNGLTPEYKPKKTIKF